MLFSTHELNKAKEIGPFGMTDEFMNASAETLHEMEDGYEDWLRVRFFGQHTYLHEVEEYFERLSSPGAQIYTSFLGRIALDLEGILGSKEAVRKLEVSTYAPEFNSMSPKGGTLHRDDHETDAVLGIRYLVTNRYPTEIPELGETKPGVIYRTSNKHTWHKRPKYIVDESIPRTLLVINV